MTLFGLRRARKLGHRDARTGAVTFMRRFSSGSAQADVTVAATPR